jgi:energy-converting hydrogenase Eha subunit E
MRPVASRSQDEQRSAAWPSEASKRTAVRIRTHIQSADVTRDFRASKQISFGVALAAIVVLGVLAFSALRGWMLLRAVTFIERARRDRRYRRRIMFTRGAVCAVGGLFVVVQLAMRQPLSQILPILILVLGDVLSLIHFSRILKTPH